MIFVSERCEIEIVSWILFACFLLAILIGIVS